MINEQYGINGSLQRRETNIPGNQPEIEHYHFTINGNMQAYIYDNLLYTYYGYDNANSRKYKISYQNSPTWINGQPQPTELHLRNIMFYPNSYLNFNNDGHYTKHYYNGMERIASRLGDQGFGMEQPTDGDLLSRKNDLGKVFIEQFQEMLGNQDSIKLLDTLQLSSLNPSADGLYYYHTNHLGSTSFVTDENASVVQGFLYAPFGEITNEYNNSFGSSVLPKYSFNAKELDEETGMYYYEARYYQPPTFTSRDALFEEKPWLTPYHYCSNNPVGRVDPSGMLDSPIIDFDGNCLGTDADGWKGTPIVMDKKNFKQGMSHHDALKKGTKLDEYGKGIKISDKTWSEIESKGGDDRLKPYVENNSNRTVYYKPEKDIGNYKNDGAYPIEAGKDLYIPVDGVATSKYNDNVGKIPTNATVTITDDGGLDIDFWGFGGLIRLLPYYGWVDTNWLKQQQKGGDNSWNKLFKKAKKIGRRSY